MTEWFDRLRSRATAFLHDLAMIPLAWMGAYWLRSNLGEIPPEMLADAVGLLWLAMPVQSLLFWRLGLYRGVWRFASLTDLERILKAVVTGALVISAGLFALNRLEGVPRSVPVLFAFNLVLLLAGPRLLYRWQRDRRIDLRRGTRVLIVGAGRAGEMLARDLLRDPQGTYAPVGFVDDKPHRRGSDVHGLPVLGPCDDLPRLAREQLVELLMLAIPSASSREMQRLVGLCEASGLPFRTVPPLKQLMSGGPVGLHQLRPVAIEDLLGREPVTLDWPGIRQGLAGRRILVSGAGGSIGSELCRQLAGIGPASLTLVEQGEFNLYRIDLELRETFPDLILNSRLLDVGDRIALRRAFADGQPEVVFHAAAYKHVPLLEANPRAAVRNNVLGTRLIADIADAAGCAQFVLISTDKAVRPGNVMGATKRLGEQYIQALNQRSVTTFSLVRFGNVLDSAGSVVPLFRDQIARGGPVTVTDPEVERYFMTIPEACQLIMQAAVIPGDGEIHVLDMGEPVKIRYLAEQMIRLAGKRPSEIAIRYVGLRPGEKLAEELFYQNEALTPTAYARIHIARQNPPDWNRITACLDHLAELCIQGNEAALRETLHQFAANGNGQPERVE
ncbi:MAG: nucleoside-diphosphate sugar epimerase/dehydratase [Pseudomonadota bacterium]